MYEIFSSLESYFFGEVLLIYSGGEILFIVSKKK